MQAGKMKTNTVKISQINFQGISLPEITIEKGELYRIELGISHGINRKLLSEILKKECNQQNIATVNNLKKRINIKSLFKSKTVKDFLAEKEIPKEETERLINICENNQLERVKGETKLDDLSEQEFRLIKFFVLLIHNNKIFIETGGMYLSALVGTYEIIKEFLKNGGIVIELAYPHFDKTDELKWYATRNLKSVQIGKMKIEN